jgi:hypothetical protein
MSTGRGSGCLGRLARRAKRSFHETPSLATNDVGAHSCIVLRLFLAELSASALASRSVGCFRGPYRVQQAAATSSAALPASSHSSKRPSFLSQLSVTTVLFFCDLGLIRFGGHLPKQVEVVHGQRNRAGDEASEA